MISITFKYSFRNTGCHILYSYSVMAHLRRNIHSSLSRKIIHNNYYYHMLVSRPYSPIFGRAFCSEYTVLVHYVDRQYAQWAL